MSVLAGRVRKWIFLGVRIAIVVVIYYFIFSRVPLSALGPLLAPGLIMAFVLAILLNVIQAMLCTVRWRLLAYRVRHVPGFRKSFSAYMEGLFFNQALPSFIGGDAIRILRWQAFRVKAVQAFLSVFRDRLYGAIGAASFTVWAGALLWSQPVERYKVLTMLALGGGVTAACVVVLSLSHWPRLTRILSRIHGIRTLSMILVGEPLARRIIWSSLGISVVAQLLPGLSVYLLALALDIDLSFMVATSITGAIFLVSMIPVSLAGWGVREAGFLVILGPLGVSSEKALMLGISLGLAGLCGALLGGISILLSLSTPSVPPSPAASGDSGASRSIEHTGPVVR